MGNQNITYEMLEKEWQWEQDMADAFGITEDTPFCGQMWLEGEGAK